MQGLLVLAFVTLGAGQISFEDTKPKNDDNSLPKDDKSSSSFSNIFKNNPLRPSNMFFSWTDPLRVRDLVWTDMGKSF